MSLYKILAAATKKLKVDLREFLTKEYERSCIYYDGAKLKEMKAWESEN